jgi:hypothetical protein
MVYTNHSVSAEGNPDEEKIGAFGVGKQVFGSRSSRIHGVAILGFYSLFSITEEPFVKSGGKFSSSDAKLAIDFVQINGWAFTGRTRKIK